MDGFYAAKLRRFLASQKMRRSVFQPRLTAHAKTGQLTDALLMRRPPELFGRIDAQFFIQADSNMRANMLNRH